MQEWARLPYLSDGLALVAVVQDACDFPVQLGIFTLKRLRFASRNAYLDFGQQRDSL